MEEMQSWATLISNLGFPVVISIYLLVRFERKIETLESTIQTLAEVIRQIKN